MIRQRGFTLLELMIVVVIVAVLASIAISSYTEQVHKSRRAAAYNDIAQVQLQLERWRAENPSYANCTPPPTPCGSGTYPATMPTDNYYTIALTGQTALTYQLKATRIANTAQANDRCGDLTANGNIKPSWGGDSNCNN